MQSYQDFLSCLLSVLSLLIQIRPLQIGFLLSWNSFHVDSLVTHYPFVLKWEFKPKASISNFSFTCYRFLGSCKCNLINSDVLTYARNYKHRKIWHSVIGDQTEKEPRRAGQRSGERVFFRSSCKQKALLLKPLKTSRPSLCELWGSGAATWWAAASPPSPEPCFFHSAHVKGRGELLSSCRSPNSRGMIPCSFMPSISAGLLLPSQGKTCPLGEFGAKCMFCPFSSKCWYSVFRYHFILVEQLILVLISLHTTVQIISPFLHNLFPMDPHAYFRSCISHFYYSLDTHFSCWNFTGSGCSLLLFPPRPHCLQL